MAKIWDENMRICCIAPKNDTNKHVIMEDKCRSKLENSKPILEGQALYLDHPKEVTPSGSIHCTQISLSLYLDMMATMLKDIKNEMLKAS